MFGDRLVDENDTNWLYNMLRECVRSHFRENFDALLEHLGRTDGKVTECLIYIYVGRIDNELHFLSGHTRKFGQSNVRRLHGTGLAPGRPNLQRS